MNADFYSILGVAPTATVTEIKERFRFLSHAFHPDKFATAAQRKTAEDEFKSINEAYQVLSDPIQRAHFDTTRSRTSSPPPRPSPAPASPTSAQPSAASIYPPEARKHIAQEPKTVFGIIWRTAIILWLVVVAFKGMALWHIRSAAILRQEAKREEDRHHPQNWEWALYTKGPGDTQYQIRNDKVRISHADPRGVALRYWNSEIGSEITAHWAPETGGHYEATLTTGEKVDGGFTPKFTSESCISGTMVVRRGRQDVLVDFEFRPWRFLESAER